MSLHPASLVSPVEHSPKLLQLLDLNIARGLIERVVQSTAEVVTFALDIPSTSSSRGRTISRTSKYSDFTRFVTRVIERAEVSISDLLVTLVYIQRAKPFLSVQTEEWALHRVFLGALIVASKYTNDSTLKNIHWAMASDTFGKRDIGRIEREFIEVLDWDLTVTEADLLIVCEALLHLLPTQRIAVPSAPTSSPIASSDSDSSESSSHWSSDEESDSDSRSTPATSPGPVTPSHDAFSPVRSHSKNQATTVSDSLQHPFWHVPQHPLSLQVVA